MASEVSQEGPWRPVAQPKTASVPPETALGVWLSWLQSTGALPPRRPWASGPRQGLATKRLG